MYASIRRYEGVDGETAAEVSRRGYAELWQKLSERAGFIAYETIIGKDSVATITVFDNWVTAEESNALAAAWIRDNIGDLGWPEPQITAGEIYEDDGAERPPFSPPTVKFTDPDEEVSNVTLLVRRVRTWLGDRKSS
jgi:hypothetical protein